MRSITTMKKKTLNKATHLVKVKCCSLIINIWGKITKFSSKTSWNGQLHAVTFHSIKKCIQ